MSKNLLSTTGTRAPKDLDKQEIKDKTESFKNEFSK